MSTKIYDGYKIEGISDFGILNKFVLDFKITAYKKAKELVAREIATLAVEAFDSVTKGDTKSITNWEENVAFKDNNCISWARNLVEYKYKQIYKSNSRDPRFDFQCSLVLYPLFKNTILARLVSEKEEYAKIFLGLSGISEYGYWNNSDDYPKGVTSKDWDVRGKHWDEAIKNSARLSFDLLRIDIFEFYYMDSSEIISQIPTLEERIKEQAFDAAVGQIYDEKRNAKKADDKQKAHEFMEIFYESRRFIKDTDEGQKVLKNKKNELRSLLRENITLKDLLGDDIEVS